MAFLELLPPKLQRIHTVVEEMASLRIDESVIRGLGHLLDEIKGKVRGLRELLGNLGKSYAAALQAATAPEKGSRPEEGSSSSGGGAREADR